jgi:hypothetical protein
VRGRRPHGSAAQAVDEDGNDVLVVFEPSAGDGLGQLSDGVQQILGADVVANRAVGHRGVERCGHTRENP